MHRDCLISHPHLHFEVSAAKAADILRSPSSILGLVQVGRCACGPNAMDRRIFDQLDRLEAGARIESRPSQYAYEDSSARFSAYDGQEPVYGGDRGYRDEGQYFGDMFAEQGMAPSQI